jgi:hypothetical protein
MMVVVESNFMLQQSVLPFDDRPTESTDEMSCDRPSERLPSTQSLKSHRRGQVVKNKVFDIRDEEAFVRKELCLTSTKPMIRKRTVRFQIPAPESSRLPDVENDFVSSHAHGDDSHLYELFWSRKDLFVSRKHAQLKASVIRGKFPTEVEALECVIQNSRVTIINGDGKRCHEEDSKPFSVDSAASCLQYLNSEAEDVLTMYNWSSSYVRGLEDYVTPIMSSERRYMIHQFLSYQDFLRHNGVPGTSVEAALCERSRKLSQNARTFAFKMAIGDALAASHHP